MRHKDFEDCLLDTICYLALALAVGVFIFACIQVPIALLIVVEIYIGVFGLAGICYWWNNRG